MTILHDQIRHLPEVRGRWPGTCFGCSPDHPHGLRLRFRHTPAGVVTVCSVPAAYCGFDGLVHGGIIGTLLDEAAAWALLARHGTLGLTRDMTTRFLKPVRTGAELLLSALVLRFEPPTASVAATIHDADGLCLAEGTSTWSFPRLGRIADLAGVPEETLDQFLADCRHHAD